MVVVKRSFFGQGRKTLTVNIDGGQLASERVDGRWRFSLLKRRSRRVQARRPYLQFYDMFVPDKQRRTLTWLVAPSCGLGGLVEALPDFVGISVTNWGSARER